MNPLTDINLDFVNASRLLIPPANPESVQLILVGCGGTGSWLAPAVVRLARLLDEKYHRVVVTHFVDPDRVEEKNVYRQNFCRAEVGQNKAEALAFRYGAAWGVQVYAHPLPANKIDVPAAKLNVLIGCVDRASARRSIQGMAAQLGNSWWLDCGNEKSSGQILLTCERSRPEDPFGLPGFCAWLPPMISRAPDLLEDEPEELAIDTSRLSCADLALLDAQGMSINQRMAGEAADYLVRMLVTGNLQKMGTYLNLEAGSARSVYITPESVNGL